MMIAMIPNPHDRIARQRHGRAGRKKKLERFRHLEAPMRQVTMQIKCRADSAPKKDHQHDREIGKLKTMEQSDQPQHLQTNQYNKNEELKFFVLKHAGESWRKGKQPTGRGIIRRETIRWICRGGKLLFPRSEESNIFQFQDARRGTS